jgi:hypothetical protein
MIVASTANVTYFRSASLSLQAGRLTTAQADLLGKSYASGLASTPLYEDLGLEALAQRCRRRKREMLL